MRGEYRQYEDKKNLVEARYDTDYGCQLHFHSKLELLYFLGETHDATISGVRDDMSENEICFVNSFEPHCFSSKKENKLYMISFSDDNLLIFNNLYPHLYFQNFLKDKEFNKSVLPIIQKLYLHQNELNAITKNAYVNLILGKIIERYQLEKAKNISNEVRDILFYIDENYSENLTRELMANRMGYSENYFSMIFKKNIGMSFVDYVNMVRCRGVAEMKNNDKNKKYNLLEIVTRNGFDSLATYYRAIKKKYN